MPDVVKHTLHSAKRRKSQQKQRGCHGTRPKIAELRGFWRRQITPGCHGCQKMRGLAPMVPVASY